MACVETADLQLAEAELLSLLRKCEAVLAGRELSPSRTTLMTNRVAALRKAVDLVHQAQAHSGSMTGLDR